MKRKIIKITVIVLLAFTLLFILRSCISGIMGFGALIPNDNTPFHKNKDSFDYIVNRVNGIFDEQNSLEPITSISVLFYLHDESITVWVEPTKFGTEKSTFELQMTADDIKHYENVAGVFKKWNMDLPDISVYNGQVVFLASEMPYALIYRENGWYPPGLNPDGKTPENFYSKRITFKWFHASYRGIFWERE